MSTFTGAVQEEANHESVLKKLEDAKLQREYQEALAVLERIPPEVIDSYANRDLDTLSKKRGGR